MQTRTYNVYKFDELSEAGKQKAIERYSDINVDFDWWNTGMINEMASEYGLKVDENKMNFDLDRGSFLYFNNGIKIIDEKKFLEGMTVITKDMDFELWIDTSYGACGTGGNFVETGGNFDEIDENKIQNRLKDFLDKALSYLKKDYEGLTSSDSIIETLKANDYDFTEDGKID